MGFDLDKLKVSSATTREFRLDGVNLGGDDVVVLVVRHAGDSNAPYWNAVLRQINEQRGRTAKATAALLAADRENAARLFAKYVVTDWRNAYETGATKPTPFSIEKCEELLVELSLKASDLFGALRSFVTEADNFRATVDGADLGKP